MILTGAGRTAVEPSGSVHLPTSGTLTASEKAPRQPSVIFQGKHLTVEVIPAMQYMEWDEGKKCWRYKE